ncbi:GNAT family N-acetyltransferase [Pseudomonas sp. Leaf58]|uniref:hypothetical protein n=1 Tax=Pseudomonas TaxID=286 RepID=UPI0006F456FA|nr:hypothetical protein [Pseudomonas sp. Leaf58]AYG45791.1 GNAT family N-acetyltransferase [Pseudomonas sp. Leaf58]KQN58996.1 GNAT family acetyltransferase [Pseudomonas sp. Leaf58]
MACKLPPADDSYRTFARELTRRAMLPYYREYDLLWIEEAFDEAWGWREQWLVTEGETLAGWAVQRHLPLLRLMVFNSNPAPALYARNGFVAVGQDDCFIRMQRVLAG